MLVLYKLCIIIRKYYNGIVSCVGTALTHLPISVKKKKSSDFHTKQFNEKGSDFGEQSM